MIENHYELNVALNGRHYSRVVFPSILFEAEAQARAERFKTALNDNAVPGDTFECSLTHVKCSGHSVEF